MQQVNEGSNFWTGVRDANMDSDIARGPFKFTALHALAVIKPSSSFSARSSSIQDFSLSPLSPVQGVCMMAFVMLAQHLLRTSSDELFNRMRRLEPFQWPTEGREVSNAKLEEYDNDMKEEDVLVAGIKNKQCGEKSSHSWQHTVRKPRPKKKN